MSELRLNVVTREWVVIAPDRAERPTDHPPPSVRAGHVSHDPSCPFCAGNETKTPEELLRVDHPDPPGWLVRVVRNKFPVLSSEQHEPTPRHAGLMHAVGGYGHHEVIIETPVHNLPIARMKMSELRALLFAYRSRSLVCRRDPRVALVILFKNHGAGAGTSLIHPHSQLIATPVVSYQVRDRIRGMEEHFALYGECVLCRMIADELSAQVRLLHQNRSFVALIPYAALSRYHIWVFPLRHMAWFGDISHDEVDDLADILRTVLGQLYYGLGDPDFNYLIRSAPRVCSPDEFHWYLSIVPRVGQAAGFELGSGIYVNPSLPEQSAAFLRAVRVPAPEPDALSTPPNTR
ncbi:MAG: DUF4921 family protein [Polyangiaceae bacterium]|nr:DUF4921 family protein [Polyangiaceae bacterium]